MATVTRERADFLTPKEVAYRLGIGVHSVYRAVNRGELPAIRLLPRGAIRIHRSAVEPEPSTLSTTATRPRSGNRQRPFFKREASDDPRPEISLPENFERLSAL